MSRLEDGDGFVSTCGSGVYGSDIEGDGVRGLKGDRVVSAAVVFELEGDGVVGRAIGVAEAGANEAISATAICLRPWRQNGVEFMEYAEAVVVMMATGRNCYVWRRTKSVEEQRRS